MRHLTPSKPLMSAWLMSGLLPCAVIVCLGLMADVHSAASRPLNRQQSLIEVIQMGMQAETDHDAKGLMKASLALSRMGARPIEGGDDLAQQWRRAAIAQGAKPTKSPSFRGRTLGSAYKSGSIGPGDVFSTHQSFYAGQKADVLLVPKNHATLTLRIADDEGHDVCSVSNASEDIGCSWVPSFTGRHDIEISNESQSRVGFYMVLN